MHKWKVLIADGLHEQGRQRLSPYCQIEDNPDISPSELFGLIHEFDGLIVRSRTKVTKELIEQGSNLKVIGRAGVGVDNIDLGTARVNSVLVVNTPYSTITAVAEHTIMLMLALARQVIQANASMKAGHWLKKDIEGCELSGKVLGIIGVGRIGSAVAQRANAFGMHILGFDNAVSDEDIQSRGLEPVPLNLLLAKSDFISIHVPLTLESKKMMNGESLARMKIGSRLICTARGGIIDETALLAGLDSGRIAGAALDVFSKEPPGLSALVSHPAVIATPHIGAQTEEAQIRASIDVAEEVAAALQGKPLRWRVI